MMLKGWMLLRVETVFACIPVSTNTAHVLGPGQGVGGRVGAATAGGRGPGHGHGVSRGQWR